MKGKVAFVGSGNVAWHLAKALDLAGLTIYQIVSKNKVTGKDLAKIYGAYFNEAPHEVLPECDYVFLTVPDSQIESVLKLISCNGPIFIHCAGSISLETIQGLKPRTGVFYPLQTFTIGRKINYFEVPIFVEASDTPTFKQIFELADSISNKVKFLDSPQRLNLHLAAVIANNFTNYLMGQSEQLMNSHQLAFEDLKPLITETVNKAFDMGPSMSQTGPAARNDTSTIEKHLKMLEGLNDLQELYALISKGIQKK